ncbi:MAG: hypothetical protein JWM36_2599 [Hyphomicrobiales bacterium]|nr:hypothetical protein [Hyphomicrobiales bacterium]
MNGDQRVGAISLTRAEIDALFVSNYEAWHAGRFAEVVRSYFHPQARLIYSGAGTFPPFSGTHVGHNGIICATCKLAEIFETPRAHIHDIVFENNRASVHSCLYLRHRPSRRAAELEICDRYVLDLKGQIVEWVAYADTGVLAHLAGYSEPSWD